MNTSPKWHLIVDVAKCSNCNNCFLAIKDEYCGNDFAGYSCAQPLHGQDWLQIKTRERGAGSLLDVAYLPTTCNQCASPPCVKAAPHGAVVIRDDGIVLIHPEKAKGHKRIVDACPYGHIWWNEALQLPQKWCFDAHLLDSGWTEPRITQVCATKALTAVLLPDAVMQAKAQAENLEVLHSEFGTKPRIWYRNLYRFNREFIAGTVVGKLNGVEECLPELKVELHHLGVLMATQVTDFFGDFKFDNLGQDSGEYLLKIAGSSKEFKHNLQLSINLGAVDLGD